MGKMIGQANCIAANLSQPKFEQTDSDRQSRTTFIDPQDTVSLRVEQDLKRTFAKSLTGQQQS